MVPFQPSLFDDITSMVGQMDAAVSALDVQC